MSGDEIGEILCEMRNLGFRIQNRPNARLLIDIDNVDNIKVFNVFLCFVSMLDLRTTFTVSTRPCLYL